MKRVGLWIVILGLIVAASSVAAKDAKLVTSSGQVVSIDAKAKAMVVKFENSPGHATDVPFIVRKKTKVIKAGHQVGIDGIMAGDKVKVTFRTVNGKSVAVQVGIESKRAA